MRKHVSVPNVRRVCLFAAASPAAFFRSITGADLAASASADLPRGLSYTFSVGVDQHRRGAPLAQLMARADVALYAATQSGRNRVMAAA